MESIKLRNYIVPKPAPIYCRAPQYATLPATGNNGEIIFVNGVAFIHNGSTWRELLNDDYRGVPVILDTTSTIISRALNGKRYIITAAANKTVTVGSGVFNTGDAFSIANLIPGGADTVTINAPLMYIDGDETATFTSVTLANTASCFLQFKDANTIIISGRIS